MIGIKPFPLCQYFVSLASILFTNFQSSESASVLFSENHLNSPNVDIFVPTGYHFLLRYLNSINASDSLRHLANYYAERNLQEYDSLAHEPHRMAATALFAAMCQQEERLGNWSGDFNHMWKPLEIETGFKGSELAPYAVVMVRHVNEEPETASKRRLQACKKKYGKPEHLSVSLIPTPRFHQVVQGNGNGNGNGSNGFNPS